MPSEYGVSGGPFNVAIHSSRRSPELLAEQRHGGSSVISASSFCNLWNESDGEWLRMIVTADRKASVSSPMNNRSRQCHLSAKGIPKGSKPFRCDYSCGE